MKNIKIELYRSKNAEKPLKATTIPLKTIDIGIQFLPKEIKSSLEREGIDLMPCRDLIKEKDLKGTFIEVEHWMG